MQCAVDVTGSPPTTPRCPADVAGSDGNLSNQIVFTTLAATTVTVHCKGNNAQAVWKKLDGPQGRRRHQQRRPERRVAVSQPYYSASGAGSGRPVRPLASRRLPPVRS